MGAAPKPKTNVVVPMRTLSESEALAWLVGREQIETSAAALARDWRWNSKKVKSCLDRWSAAGRIVRRPGDGGRMVITAKAGPAAAAPEPADTTVADSTPVSGLYKWAAQAPPLPIFSEEAPAAITVAEPVAPATGESPAIAAAPAASGQPDGAAAVSEPVAPAAGESPAVAAAPATSGPPDSPAPVAAPVSAPELPSAPKPAPMVRPPALSVIRTAAFPVPPAPLPPRGSGFVNVLAYAVAVALAGIAAYFSISGMIVLFPGAPEAIVTMGVIMEAAKLVTVAFLAHQWRMLARLSRLVLVLLVMGLAAINAAGVYSQLVAAHFGDRVTATSAVESEAAALAARTEVQAQTVADLDRRVAQIDGVIAEMVKRGRTSGALDALATQRKQREALVGQRRHEAETLAALKSEAGAVAARTKRIEIEAAPIMYVAQLVGGTTEQAIRFLILLMVLTCDPLALALTAAASRPRWRPLARQQGARM